MKTGTIPASPSGWKLVQTITAFDQHATGTLYLYANESLRRCLISGEITISAQRPANKDTSVGSISSTYRPRFTATNVIALYNSNNEVIAIAQFGKNNINDVLALTSVSALEIGYHGIVYLEWIY